MNNLFNQTEKLIKFNRSVSQQLQIKHVLNPYTQLFIDVQLANTLGILNNGYYRNRYGGLIPLHIAASKGYIEFTIHNQMDNEEMEIEYRSKHSPIVTSLLIRQVYDLSTESLLTYRQAMDKGYLDTESFLYSCAHLSLPIHEAFLRGLILGELRTSSNENKFSKKAFSNPEKNDFEYDMMFSTLTNIVNGLSEFNNTIDIHGDRQLTSDGFIHDKKTGNLYLLSKALDLGFVSFKDHLTQSIQINRSEHSSTFINETIPMDMDISYHEDIPLFSDTLIFDLMKPSKDDQSHLTNINQLLSVINTC